MSNAAFDPRERADARLQPDKFDGRKWTYKPICADPSNPADRIRYMARSGGYVMVRKPGNQPFVLSEKEWARLPLFKPDASLEEGR